MVSIGFFIIAALPLILNLVNRSTPQTGNSVAQNTTRRLFRQRVRYSFSVHTSGATRPEFICCLIFLRFFGRRVIFFRK